MRYIFMAIMATCLLLLTGCNVHEFPDEDAIAPGEVDVLLRLHFNADMPTYQEVEYTTRSDDDEAVASHYVRYIVRVFKEDDIQQTGIGDADPVYETVVTQAETLGLDKEVSVRLQENEDYRVLVWADYVDREVNRDTYYITGNFNEITHISQIGYSANDDYKDAFKGMEKIDTYKGYAKSVDVEMERPFAKFQIIATDMEAFLRNMQQRVASYTRDDFKVKLRYYGYMPSAFGIVRNQPVDSWAGVEFDGRFRTISENETELGFDYVFINVGISSVTVSVDIYDAYDELISSGSAVEIPLRRGELTVVRGPFMTMQSQGGATINPEFDGEFNIVFN
jgi:hypothetical protein